MKYFTKQFNKYACIGDSITSEHDGFTLTATLAQDHDATPDDDEGMSDEARAAWKRDEWFYVGVCVTVSRNDVQLTGDYSNALWGVDCNNPEGDGDNSYLVEVANDCADEAMTEARAKLRQLCAGITP